MAGGHIENGYFDNIACDLRLVTCFIRKRIQIYRKILFQRVLWGCHRVLLHPRLTRIFCDPFDLSDPKLDPFSNWDYFVRQLWFLNSFIWFTESTGLICSQAKHLTTILNFVTFLTQTHDFDPLFKVLLVIFRLGTGRHSIRLEKMILDCKFQILGIKTTMGHYIIIFSRNSSCLIVSSTGVHCQVTRYSQNNSVLCQPIKFGLRKKSANHVVSFNWCQTWKNIILPTHLVTSTACLTAKLKCFSKYDI